MRMRGKKPIFNYKDTWSMDNTLQPIILEGLKKFKSVLEDRCSNNLSGCGYPVSLNSTEEWFEILDKMIYAFDDKAEPDLDDYGINYEFSPRKKGEDGRVRSSMKRLHTEEQDKAYRDARDEWNRKVKEGRQLFAKYFDNLWW